VLGDHDVRAGEPHLSRQRTTGASSSRSPKRSASDSHFALSFARHSLQSTSDGGSGGAPQPLQHFASVRGSPTRTSPHDRAVSHDRALEDRAVRVEHEHRPGPHAVALLVLTAARVRRRVFRMLPARSGERTAPVVLALA
jgi:hypothetical protein